MKQLALSGCLIALISVNIYGSENTVLSRDGVASVSIKANSGFSQFEMPIIKITTVSGDSIALKETYTEAKISVINNQGISEMTDTNISVRLRGNVTLAADKKSYKVKFAEKQNVLNVGIASSKVWCLISNCYDGSLLRNLAICRIADSLDGLSYSPNCISVELFINDEYRGVYLLCEDVNITRARVEVEQAPESIENNGYLIEMSRYEENDSFVVDKAAYAVKSDLSQNESIKRKQLEYITEYMTKCLNSLKGGDRTVVEQCINLQSLIDMYIVNEIVKNLDAGWSSFYLFKKAGGKLEFGPPWDFDLAMGNVNCVKGFDSSSGINPYHVLDVTASSNPWFCYALRNKWFRDSVLVRWTVLKNKLSNLPEIVTTEAETHYKSYCRNFEKWNNVLGKQVYIEPKQIVALSSFKEHYTYLSDWLDKRIKWLTNYYSTDDFASGTFIDESGMELTLATNLVSVSPVLAHANSPDVKMTYEILPTQGIFIAIENGGTESWETQIGVSGFMIEKGAQYELSFDYKCSEALTVGFNIQQNYEPYSSYYFKRVNCTTEFQHYQYTFTASKSDNNCVLVFSLGGEKFNGTEVTIDNMSFVLKESSNVKKSGVQKNTNLLQNSFYDAKKGIVRLNLPATALIDLHLYSAIGRKVYAVSERKNTGEYVYRFKNIGLVPGMYIGQIKAGAHSKQWKMMIEK